MKACYVISKNFICCSSLFTRSLLEWHAFFQHSWQYWCGLQYPTIILYLPLPYLPFHEHSSPNSARPALIPLLFPHALSPSHTNPPPPPPPHRSPYSPMPCQPPMPSPPSIPPPPPLIPLFPQQTSHTHTLILLFPQQTPPHTHTHTLIPLFP